MEEVTTQAPEAPVVDQPTSAEPTQVEQPTTQPDIPSTTEEKPKLNVEEIQRKAYRHAMDQVDEAIKELGLEKPDGVKTTEFLKQILTKDGTKPKGDDVKQTTDDKDAIISTLKASLKEKDDAINELKNSTVRAKKELFVDSLIGQSKLNIPSNLTEQEVAQMGDFLKRGLKSEIDTKVDFKEVDGRFIAYKKDGQPYLDEMGDYIEPQKLLEKEFSVFLAKPTAPQTPRGTGGTKAEPKATVIPSGVKTKYDFYEYLQKKGMILNSPEFMDQLAKAKEENPALFR